MKKQTAVEWLEDNMYSLKIPAIYFVDLIDLVNQAKSMEKKQIVDAWFDGSYGGGEFMINWESADEYYNGIYGGVK